MEFKEKLELGKGLNDSVDRTFSNESSKLTLSEVRPKDRYNMMYMIYFLYGAGKFLPWQAVLNTMEFFIAEMTTYQPQFVFPFAVNSLVAVALFLTPLITSKMGYQKRVNVGFFILAMLEIALPVSVIFGNSQLQKFAISFSILLLFPIFNGVIQGSNFGLAAFMPQKYIGALQIGSAIAGLGMNLVRCISLIFFPEHTIPAQVKSVTLFFSIASFSLLLCAFAGFYERKDPFYIHHQRKLDDKFAADKEAGVTFGQKIKKMGECLRLQWLPLTVLFMNLLFTFSVLPGVSNDLPLKFIQDPDWRNLFLNTLINLGDFCARMGTLYLPFLRVRPPYQMLLVNCRLFFIFNFFMIANKQGPAFLYQADWFICLNQFFFMFTHGQVVLNTSISAVKDAPFYLKEEVGALLGTMLMGGLAVGTVVQIPMKSLVPEQTG